MVDLGFILSNGTEYQKEENERGHIEVAKRIIKEQALEARFEKCKSSGKWLDEVDFLIFEEGAVKIGNRWGARVVSYYPRMLERKTSEAIKEYTQRNYKEDPVFPPSNIPFFR